MSKTAIDTGTPEIHQHYQTKPALISQRTGRATHVKIQDQTELDRLLLNNWITPLHYTTGEAFAKDIYDAGLHQLRAANYERVIGSGGGYEITGREAFKRVKVQKAMRYMARRAGQDASRLALNVCLDDAHLDKKMATGSLHKALEALTSFYDDWH